MNRKSFIFWTWRWTVTAALSSLTCFNEPEYSEEAARCQVIFVRTNKNSMPVLPYLPGLPRLRAWPIAGMKSFFLDMTRGTVQVPFFTVTLKAFSTIHVSPESRMRS